VTLTSGNPMRIVLMTLLLFEIIVFGLAVPVMIYVSSVSTAVAGVLGGGAALLALVAAALIRKPIGYPLGWITQFVGVAMGLFTASMFAIGGLFLVLWVVSFVLGKKLDAGRPQTSA
jgi:hypothetical protein